METLEKKITIQEKFNLLDDKIDSIIETMLFFFGALESVNTQSDEITLEVLDEMKEMVNELRPLHSSLKDTYIPIDF